MPRVRPAPTPFSDFRLDFTLMARRRRWLGMTQRQVAQAVGCQPITIYRTERNKSDPSMHQVVSIARVLGIPLDQLMTEVVEIESGQRS